MPTIITSIHARPSFLRTNGTYLKLVISVSLVPDEALCALFHDLGLRKRLYEDHFDNS